jgi:iron complex outermembrane receptor protein
MMKNFTNGLQAKLSLFLCSALLLALPQMSQGATGFKTVTTEVEKFGMVTGIVLDETGAPIPGASILVKGTTTGTVTDLEGKFSLDVASNAVLVISYLGYDSKEVSVNGLTTLSI